MANRFTLAGMVKITFEYLGDLHCIATHEPSGRTLDTDAPKDNEGRGESFSPTDLVATALGSCMATVMGIYAKRKGIELRGMKVEVTKEMTPAPPRRIARLGVTITMPPLLARDPAMEHAALNCPVILSIHPEIEKPVKFHWSGE